MSEASLLSTADDDETRVMLRDSAREFVADRMPRRRLRGPRDSAAGVGELWPQIAELGWTGLLVPLEHGGSGLGMQEMNVVPHVAQNTTNRASALDGRTTRHPAGVP